MPETPSDTDATTYSSGISTPEPEPFTLRPYQVEGVEWLIKHQRAILADQMGLGKTAEIVTALAQLQTRDLLIVAPASAFSTWVETLELLYPELVRGGVSILRGNKGKWDWRNSRVVITTFQSMRYIRAEKDHFQTIVVDEAHTLRNRKAKTYWPILRSFTSARLWLLTGTPIISGADNLWTLLNLLDPTHFTSYWSYVNKFCYITDNGFGKSISGVRNAAELRELLEKYMLRRTVKQLQPDTVGIVRQTIKLKMTKEQRITYRDLEKDLIAELEGVSIIVPNKLAALIRMRQLLVSPKLLHSGATLPGAAFQALHAELPANEPSVIFTPFVKALDHLTEYMKGRPVYRIHGQLSSQERELELERFANSKRPDKILACSLGIATSFSLPPDCRVGVFVGYDWTPSVNEQAEGRLYRPARGDQGRIVKYLVHEDSIDERVKEILNYKYDIKQLILDRYRRPLL